MTIAIYPGSFDPFTNGHLDILKSGAELFEKVIIAIPYTSQKQSFIPVNTRKSLIETCIKSIPNTEVDLYEGLTVDYAKKRNASVLLRGLRNSADFEYEMQLSQNNNAICNEIKTIFLITKPEYSYISSSSVREIYTNNGDISKFVPKPVLEYLKKSIHDI